MIETESVSKSYGEKAILDGISFSVKSGEIFGLIGPSGSGKSTLLRILDLIEYPTKGKLSILGEDALDSRLRFKIRRRMAMLHQKPIIFNTSVFDNIALGMKYRGAHKREIEEQVNDALEKIGLKDLGRRSARTLSGGEAQRVALARAIVTDPEVLFLDEPTANLDPASVEKIEEIIIRLNRETGLTTVISTHDMLQGQRLTSRMGVMMDGKLPQIGTTRDIFHRPATREIARFVRVENIYSGTVVANQNGEAVVDVGGRTISAVTQVPAGNRVNILFRAEDVTLAGEGAGKTSARNVFSGEIRRTIPSGPFVEVIVDCGIEVTALVTLSAADDLQLLPGKKILASIKATTIHVIPETNR